MSAIFYILTRAAVVPVAAFCILIQVSQVDHAIDTIQDRGAARTEVSAGR